MSRRRKNTRRGVLLLIVLSLLVLFVLIGVTFIVVAGRYTDAAKAFSRHELKGDPPAKELDGALLQLLRGSTDPQGLLSRHNLLRDLYGSDGFEGSVLSVSPGGPNGQQFLALQFGDIFNSARPSNHYYAGSVLTLLDGQGAGQTTRILRYQAPLLVSGVKAGVLFLEAFPDLPPGFLPAPGTRFVVNGKPFNGSGDGFNPTSGKLDDKSVMPYAPQFETALLPLAPLATPYGDGDESWDAADYQNLFLARIPSQMPPSGVPSMIVDPLIPSFHRPFLINYWMHRLQQASFSWGEPSFQTLRRYVVARPMPDDHPFFTGSNPAFTPTLDVDGDNLPDMPTYLDSNGNLNDTGSGIVDTPLVRGPWDVDNDNDGVPDSVWVDLGAPIKTSPDGRLYKPLFAILCVDLDGRLNINAHGTREVLAMPATNWNGVPDPLAAGPIDSVTLGQGYGPAEIRLDRLFTSAYGAVDGRDRYAFLLKERYRPRIGLPENPPAPGLPDVATFPNNTSPLSSLLLWGLPSNYVAPVVGEGNLYLTPPDLAGVGGIYLDVNGQPRFLLNQQTGAATFPLMGTPYMLQPSPFGNQPINAVQDNPYEINLVTLRGDDSAFGDEALEQLLRYSDLDMQSLRSINPALPMFTERSSIYQVLGPIPPSPLAPPPTPPSPLWRELTTRSFDIPVLNAAIPDDDERTAVANQLVADAQAIGTVLNDSHASATSLVELATKRLRATADTSLTPAQLAAYLDRQLRLILAPEIREGRRMDVNRLLGNGIDDNGNGVVDEPAEWTPAQAVWAGTPFAAPGQYGDGDPNVYYVDNARGITIDNRNNPYFSRQQFARHLYCLAMLAMDDNFRIPGATASSARRATARRIAQWAINVVDFRDADAVMTPFEYDSDPFDQDGWNVDDNFRTVETDVAADGLPVRQIVWGCESPDLLITESLAFHDRRVRDTDLEESDRPEDGDDDNDPNASKFRFPRENNDDNPANNIQQVDATLDQFRIPQGSLYLELYATGNAQRNNPARPRELYDPASGSLDLGRIVTEGGGTSPVWRVVIVRPPVNPDPSAWSADEQALLTPALVDLTNDTDQQLFRALANNDAALAAVGSTGVPSNQVQDARFIVFTERDPVTLNLPELPAQRQQYFYNYAGVAAGFRSPLLQPGEYAVVGPRPVTALGSLMRSTASPPLNDQDPSVASHQRIVMRPDGIYFYDFSPGPPQPNGYVQLSAKPALTILASANPDYAGWVSKLTTAPTGVGISVSEPPVSPNYYREPITDFPPGPGTLLAPPGPSQIQFYREPFTYYSDLRISERTIPDVPFDNPNAGASFPLAELPQSLMTGTHAKFRVALLQRLADPTRSFHPFSSNPSDPAPNPYVTVDSQTIDLTVFNGEEDSDQPPPGWEDAAENPASGQPYDIYDDSKSGINPPEHFQSRQRGLLIPPETAPGTPQGPNIWNPISTEPKLTTAQDPNPSPAYWKHPIWNNIPLLSPHSLGALNTTYGGRRGPSPPEPFEALGAPVQPFPWLTWNNRPFVSQYELLWVPSSPAWRLPFETRRVGMNLTNLADRQQDFQAPWGHLLNFFFEDTSGTNNPDFNLAVLLDWLEVPSRFAGTQKWLNPLLPARQQMPELWSYGPPFNKLSRFRDPGKVNINTIPDPTVWECIDPLLGGSVVTNTPWGNVQASLQSAESTSSSASIANRPAFYGNPMRAAAAADLMPLQGLQTTAADATLLRRDPSNPGRLLFNFPGGNVPFPPGNSANDPAINPYFQYHKIQRLANLLTTHSNVYAVWVTVGYFEVYPWEPRFALPAGKQALLNGIVDPHQLTPVPDPAHPDGYQLGPELGIDTGKVQRHRAFYLIDRSIPVGYRPGQDLNVDHTILLRRLIE